MIQICIPTGPVHIGAVDPSWFHYCGINHVNNFVNYEYFVVKLLKFLVFFKKKKKKKGGNELLNFKGKEKGKENTNGIIMSFITASQKLLK